MIISRAGHKELRLYFLQTYRQTILSLVLNGKEKILSSISSLLFSMAGDICVQEVPQHSLCNLDEIQRLINNIVYNFAGMDEIIMSYYGPIGKALMEHGMEMRLETLVALSHFYWDVGNYERTIIDYHHH